MADEQKSREQLTRELAEARARIEDAENRLRDGAVDSGAEEIPRSLEWMLFRRPLCARDAITRQREQAYGDLATLNTERTILDAVGKDLLHDIVSDYLNLLETSSAVYEKNGDYAYGIFSSGWCRAMDLASFRRCGTSDTREALLCGKWHCHESCWNDASLQSMATGQPVDVGCRGGIRLYAVPIYAGDEVVGSINFGYGDPPRDPGRLQELAARYGLPADELERNAAAYEHRPPFIIELAKERLLGSARLIGEIVRRKRAEVALQQLNTTLEQRVTERTAELEVANRELEGANAELETFTYTTAHDLRAPLRHLNGFAALLQSSDDPEEKARCAEVIRTSAIKMGVMIDALLDLSRTGRTQLQRRRVDMNRLIDEVREELAPEAADRTVSWTVHALPPVIGDPTLLRLVWVNLLDNAVKFTGHRAEAHIEIGTAGIPRRDPEREPAAQPVMIFFVRDNGVGFNPTHTKSLFGVFQRLHRDDEFPGTGIGLATVRRIVQRHGGEVCADGKLGQGAAIYFTLPVAEDAAIPVAAGSGSE